MTTDFAKHLQSFFKEYLVSERGCSSHTIRSYRDTFALLINYMNSDCKITADKLKLEHINKEKILGFLNWLEYDRGASIATRNQRWAAIRSFLAYLQYEEPTMLYNWQSLRSMRSKKHVTESVKYITVEGVKCLLEQIPSDTRHGLRDLAMLSLLYDSGARVSELTNLTPANIRIISPYVVELFGKGCKKRIVPINEQQIKILTDYITEFALGNPGRNQRPLFFNPQGGKLTGAGINYVLQKYVRMARHIYPELIPDKISPHSLRHSKAMHLLQAGVNLVYIRDILGHASIQTTEIYARADGKLKKEALERAYSDVIDPAKNMRSWESDSELKDFLKNLA